MDYLEYKITKDIQGLTVDDYLEKHNKKKNLWWRSLTGIMSTYKHHHEIFKKNATDFFNGKAPDYTKNTTVKTAKSCPAIGNAFLDKIILVKAPCDIFLSVNKKEAFYWQIPTDNLIEITSHLSEQFQTEQNNIFYGYVNIKFCLPFLIKANCDYVFLEPQYHNFDSEIKVLNGVIETKHSTQQLNINTLIKVDVLQKDFLIKKGEVLCYLWSVNELDIKENKNLILKPKTTFFGK